MFKSTNLDTPLTAKQAAILRFIYESARDTGFQPDIGEICARFGIAGTNGVVCHLKALAKKGYVELVYARARSIRILRRPDGRPFRGFAEKEEIDG
jgi:repressor LexA